MHSYNNNIEIIAINYGGELNSNPNLKFINLLVNYDLEFTESKKLFTESLYKYVSEMEKNNEYII